MKTEKKIATFTDGKNRVQLLKITSWPDNVIYYSENIKTSYYQIRHNRKVVETTNNQNYMRKVFASLINNTILQTTIEYDK